MNRRKFKLSHSLVGTAALLIVEAVLLRVLSADGASAGLILLISIVGAIANIYVAMEIVEEVRSAAHMLTLLSAVVVEFVVFFAFQYWFLAMVQPAAFPTLTQDAMSLTLHSVMIFVFNPLYLPATALGRALLLINTLGALGLVLFILQNITQFRRITS